VRALIALLAAEMVRFCYRSIAFSCIFPLLFGNRLFWLVSLLVAAPHGMREIEHSSGFVIMTASTRKMS
jgi:hypothetical protein